MSDKRQNPEFNEQEKTQKREKRKDPNKKAQEQERDRIRKKNNKVQKQMDNIFKLNETDKLFKRNYL